MGLISRVSSRTYRFLSAFRPKKLPRTAKMGLKRCAYVTLATNDLYAKSALVLVRTLKNTGTSHPIFLLVSHDNTISEQLGSLLRESFDKIIKVEALIAKNGDTFSRPDLAVTLTKIHVFDLENIDLACFLDADTMVMASIDALFETESNFSAV